MHLLDLVLLLGPLPHLLVLHQLASHVEAGLIRDGREGVFEPRSFAIEFDVVEDVDGGGQSVAVGEMLEGQYFGFLALSVDFLGRIWIGLAFGIAVISLNIGLFGGALGE
jgi:hypothetical protein